MENIQRIWSKSDYSGESNQRVNSQYGRGNCRPAKMNNRPVYEQIGSTQLPKMYSGVDHHCRRPLIGQEIPVVDRANYCAEKSNSVRGDVP